MIVVRSQNGDRRRQRQIRRALGRWAAWMLFFAAEWPLTFVLDSDVLRMIARVGLLIAMASMTIEKLPAWLQEASRS